jgi:NAD-dependent dihydropyrimidine dehydrogenase PreA subunit
MIRKIIKIDEEKCNGCGLCAEACHEAAIGIVDGKAKLLRDDYCDGLGNCLPVCPTGAITFEEREAAEYDEAAVLKNQNSQTAKSKNGAQSSGCPGSQSQVFERVTDNKETSHLSVQSKLNHWPIQIQLVPIHAPYFDNANLLVAADCAAFAHGNFHDAFMKNKITLIGCPKLDDVDYSEKLTQIITENAIKSVTVVRMEVPCCGGIEHAVVTALKNSGKMIPWHVVTLSIQGNVLTD